MRECAYCALGFAMESFVKKSESVVVACGNEIVSWLFLLCCAFTLALLPVVSVGAQGTAAKSDSQKENAESEKKYPKNSKELNEEIRKEYTNVKKITSVPDDYFSMGADETDDEGSESAFGSTAAETESLANSCIRFVSGLKSADKLSDTSPIRKILSWIEENAEYIKLISTNGDRSVNPSKNKTRDHTAKYAADLFTILNDKMIQDDVKKVVEAVSIASKKIEASQKKSDYVSVLKALSEVFEQYENLRKTLTQKFLAVSEVSVPAVPASVIRSVYAAIFLKILESTKNMSDLEEKIHQLKEMWSTGN